MTRTSRGSMPLSPGPQPEPEASAHSEHVRTHLRDAIETAGGWLSFADYMAFALHAPGLGYYAAGAAKFGEAGDFVTAPELSPVFARAAAGQIDLLLSAQGGGAVLELGPGTGQFALDTLRECAQRKSPLTEYQLLEPSADLRERQRTRLESARLDRYPIRWLDRLPVAFDGVIFANEVIDALPCERFVLRAGRLLRLGVAIESNRFVWREREPRGDIAGDERFCEHGERVLAQASAAGLEWPEGYVGEWQRDLSEWIAALASSLRRGSVLLVDYGLPRLQLLHPDRYDGTLRCHYRHRAHENPFLWPGLTDITAWVDFTTVAEAAEASGLTVRGFATQTAFLLGSAVTIAPEEAAGARRLLLPGEMGEAVKCVWLTRDLEVDLPSFALQDLRHSL